MRSERIRQAVLGLLGLPGGFWDTFIVLIQLGAILALLTIYFGRIWALATSISWRVNCITRLVSGQ